MSVGTFADQVLGLAREFKKNVRRIEQICARTERDPFNQLELYKQKFYNELSEAVIGDRKYFDTKTAEAFCEALYDLVDTSTPTYKYKGK